MNFNYLDPTFLKKQFSKSFEYCFLRLGYLGNSSEFKWVYFSISEMVLSNCTKLPIIIDYFCSNINAVNRYNHSSKSKVLQRES